ncbi:MAG: DoxX family protein [Planctomycetes bacterium]|nr:DoxX family protein [Planctomycetota bacterium]
MNTFTVAAPVAADRGIWSHAWADRVARFAVPAGRCLFAAIFILAAPGHFTAKTIASAAEHGVPLANVLVPFSGILAFLGGLSIALGYKSRIGAWLLVLFLVPVTLVMHNFWAVADPAAAQIQQIMFMKNVSMLGMALFLTWVGPGPMSLDRRL